METRRESVMFDCILLEKVPAQLVNAGVQRNRYVSVQFSVRVFRTLRVLCSSAIGISSTKGE